MTNIDIKRIGIHECCHVVLARLFRRTMAIEGIFVDRELVEKGQDLGALQLRGPLLDSEQNYVALAVTYLAGVVGENMYLLGVDAIKQKKEEVIADDTIMDWKMAGGDLHSFHYTAFAFRFQYGIDEYKLKGFCLRFLIDFLSNDEVWSMVEKLCDELLKCDDLKLSEEELDSVFSEIGLDALLDFKRSQYLQRCDEVLQFCQ